MSGKKYKNDVSDIVGTINACRNDKKDITFQIISTAVINLYGSLDNIKKYGRHTKKSFKYTKLKRLI